jgi:ATP-binding cassette, subfamily B, bacterial
LSTYPPIKPLDLQASISPNRLLGLWRLMAGYRLSYLGAVISLTIAALSRTSTYLLIRYLVDEVLGKSRFDSTLLMVAAGFVLLAAVEGSFNFLSGRLAALTSEGITRRLRNYMFDHIQRLSYAYHAQTPTGELIQRSTSDVDALRRFFSDQAINIGRVIILFAINFTTIMRLNLTLGWVSIIVIPFIVGISAFFFKKISKAYEAYQEQEATLSTTLQENLSGVRVVKAFARQEYERNKFGKDNLEKFKRGKRLLTLNAIFWPFSDVLCAFQMLTGFIVGAFLAINGVISIGTYMAYIGVVGMIIWPMRNLGRLIVNISTGLVSYHRVVEVIKQTREPLTEGDYMPEGQIKGAVAFNNVTFEYEPGNSVIKNVSFACQPGQVVALLGSTGSGKTTLVNLLPRFYDVSEGSITLDGIDLRRYPRQFLRQNIGIVEQEPFLFSRSIRENITYGVGREVPDHEVETAAKAAAIHDVIMAFPDGYATLVGEKGVTLSGGQKQRVAIARTLLKDPRILILDDSTSSVDTETEAVIRQALEELMKNRTAFIIAHRVQSIMNADLILVFDKGEICQSGKHEELVKQEGIYRQIFDIQTRIEVELEKEVTDVTI